MRADRDRVDSISTFEHVRLREHVERVVAHLPARQEQDNHDATHGASPQQARGLQLMHVYAAAPARKAEVAGVEREVERPDKCRTPHRGERDSLKGDKGVQVEDSQLAIVSGCAQKLMSVAQTDSPDGLLHIPLEQKRLLHLVDGKQPHESRPLCVAADGEPRAVAGHVHGARHLYITECTIAAHLSTLLDVPHVDIVVEPPDEEFGAIVGECDTSRACRHGKFAHRGR
eukprot:1560346-Prymnesium_polylepis.2